MKAEVECQSEAEFYFGGLTDEAKPRVAEKIARKLSCDSERIG